MYINFAKINFAKRPNFILRDMDLNALCSLNHVINPTANLSFTEISEINFDYPAYDNGEKVDEYDLLTDMRVLDVEGYGLFVMRNCKVNDNGIVPIKSCTFYSLEYEFTMKPISLEERKYCLWDPFDTTRSSIIQLILDAMPTWSLSKKFPIPSDLKAAYRTLSVDGTTIYDFLKTDVQQKFGCIIDFDTYNREIIFRSAYTPLNPTPVYISTSNLAKEIEIDQQTDNIITALEVYGADGVNIRAVNPMGQNRIYNLDYYMNEEYFTPSMISKWNTWKANFESYQQTYYNLVVELQMQTIRKETEKAALTTLNGEKQSLEKQRAVIIQAIAMDKALQSDLKAKNNEIDAKQAEINTQNSLIEEISNGITNLEERLAAIRSLTSFETFFDANEIMTLEKYFRCATLTDSSFAASNTDTYGTDDINASLDSELFQFEHLTSLRKESHDGNITFYIMRGGKIQQTTSSFTLDADIISAILQVNSDYSFILSMYLNDGEFNGQEFPSATFSVTGKCSNVITTNDDTLQFQAKNATVFMTQAVTEYQKMSIEWELYEYGVAYLKKLSTPSYNFSVSCVNFFSIEEFSSFAKKFSLGEQLYLHIDDVAYKPIAISITIDFDNPTDIKIDFGDEYHYDNNAMTYQDLVEMGVSMGKSLDSNQFNYSSFVSSGANTSVKSFMESAIDTMRNMILSGDHNEMTIDPRGLQMRKYDEETGEYDPRQLWATHNAVMFTSDNWQSAEIGIGEFVDSRHPEWGSLYGVVAPAIVGTLVAGTKAVIESEKTDGGVLVFKVDSEGASLHNASFNLYDTTGARIDLGAEFGIVAGTDKNTLFYYDNKGNPTGVRTKNNKSIKNLDELTSTDKPNVSFWLDMKGNAYFGGIVQAADYLDSNGTSMITNNGKWKEDYLDLSKIGGRVDYIEKGYQVTIENNTEAINGFTHQVSTFEQSVDKFRSTVQQYSQDVNGYENQVSTFEQAVDRFNLSVQKYSEDVNGYAENVANLTLATDKFETTVSQYSKDVKSYEKATSKLTQTVEGLTFSVSKGSDGITYSLSSDGLVITSTKEITYYSLTGANPPVRKNSSGTVVNSYGQSVLQNGWYSSWQSGWDSSAVYSCSSYDAGASWGSVVLVQGIKGKDAYTVILSDNPHVFSGNETSAYASTVTVRVLAWKGDTQVSATIGSISGRVYGMTTNVYSNNTLNAYFTVSVTANMTTTSGTLTVPVTVDGHKFNMIWSWSLATKGEKGDQGEPGNDAQVTFAKINQELNWIFRNTQSGTPTTMDDASIWSPKIRGGQIYGADFYGNSFNVMTSSGHSGSFNLYATVDKNDTYRAFAISFSSDSVSLYSPASYPLNIGEYGTENTVNIFGTVHLDQAKHIILPWGYSKPTKAGNVGDIYFVVS